MKNFTINKILIPVDFTETSDKALAEAVNIASLLKADVFILHVIEFSNYAYPAIKDTPIVIPTLVELEKYAVEKVTEIKEKIRKRSGINASAHVINGPAYSEIVNFAKEFDIDLIVMGAHGASGYKEIFIGSNAQRVVTLSEIPVLTIQKKDTKPGFKNVLIPIDNSLHSREKVNIAMLISNLFAANIRLLGLVHSDDSRELKSIKIKLESIEKLIQSDELNFKTTIVKGDSLAHEAMKYAEQEHCDLIVINTGHESKVTGVFLGALAQQIVNHSMVPVMSYKHSEGNLVIGTPGYGI